MAENLYVSALLIDPVLAVMVKEAIEDGLIDRAAAELAWQLVKSGAVGRRGDP